MRPVVRRALVALATPLALASCATTRPSSPAVAHPPVCLAIKAYAQEQLEQMAAAARTLPLDSPLRGLVVDYARLRDEVRAACSGR